MSVHPDSPVRVMIVDDHEVVRYGMSKIVDGDPGLSVIAEAGSVEDALRRATLVKPDVMLIDLQLPDGTGIDLMRSLRETDPDIKMIVLTSFDDDAALRESVEVGAKAFLLKSVRSGEINDVIHAVAAGRVLLDDRTMTRRGNRSDPMAHLTPTEKRVVDSIGDGLSNREIGEELGIAEKTVKNHITSALAKMGLQRRTQVAAWVASQRAVAWRKPTER